MLSKLFSKAAFGAAMFLALFASPAIADNSSSCTTGATTPATMLNEINNCILLQGGSNLTNAQENKILTDIVNLFSLPSTLFGFPATGQVAANVNAAGSQMAAAPLTSVLDAAFSSTPGTILYRSASAWVPLSPGTSGQVLAMAGTTGVNWSTVSGTGTVSSVSAGNGLAGGPITGSGSLTLDWTKANTGTRQTVQNGPINSSGYPNFLPATTGSLSITGQNISGSAPLVVNAWAPADSNGEHSITCALTSNPTWGGLTASNTNFLYMTLTTSAGTCTATQAATILTPVYQTGGTPSTTNGQITCNIGNHSCYIGNGSTAPQTAVVVVGEAVAGGSTVTSTVNYAYNGYYDSGWVSTLPTAAVTTTMSSNIGVVPHVSNMSVKNLTSEGGYLVGDTVANPTTGIAANVTEPFSIITRRTTTVFTTGAVAAFQMTNQSSGGVQTLTAANWAYRVTASRGW